MRSDDDVKAAITHANAIGAWENHSDVTHSAWGVYPFDDGLFALFRTTVKGTDSPVGGTAGYRYGIDLHVTVHCRHCCCGADDVVAHLLGPGPCATPVVPSFRVDYQRDDPGAWLAVAQAHVAEHLAGAGHRSTSSASRGAQPGE